MSVNIPNGFGDTIFSDLNSLAKKDRKNRITKTVTAKYTQLYNSILCYMVSLVVAVRKFFNTNKTSKGCAFTGEKKEIPTPYCYDSESKLIWAIIALIAGIETARHL